MVSSVEQRDSGSVISPSHDVQVQQNRSEPPSLHVTENSLHVDGAFSAAAEAADFLESLPIMLHYIRSVDRL